MPAEPRPRPRAARPALSPSRLWAWLGDTGRVLQTERAGRSCWPLITFGLILIELAWYAHFVGLHAPLAIDPLIAAGARHPAPIFELGETWRLLSAQLLHRDPAHLGLNLLFFLSLGGTLEHRYRTGDFVLILLASALASAALSAFMLPLPSMGLSGVLFGLFGVLVSYSFGRRRLWPRLWLLSGLILGYALFSLIIGLWGQDIDNWSHFGGLLSGLLLGFWRPPIDAARGRALPAWQPWALSLLLLAALWGYGQVIAQFGPRMCQLEQDGLSIPYPCRWSQGKNHLGDPAVGNSLGLSLSVKRIRLAEPESLEAAKARYLKQPIARFAEAGAITEWQLVKAGESRISGQPAMRLDITLNSRAGRLWTQNWLIPSGFWLYSVVLAVPEAWKARYAGLKETMERQMQLGDPEALRQLRAELSVFPGDLHLGLLEVETLFELGRFDAAAARIKALQAARPQDERPWLKAIEMARMRGETEAGFDLKCRFSKAFPEHPESPSWAKACLKAPENRAKTP